MKKQLANGNINTIGFSPLTKRVFMGTSNPKTCMWVGQKVDVTKEYESILFQFVPLFCIKDKTYQTITYDYEIYGTQKTESIARIDHKDKEGLESLIQFAKQKIKELENKK